jgi:hypothetical protein
MWLRLSRRDAERSRRDAQAMSTPSLSSDIDSIRLMFYNAYGYSPSEREAVTDESSAKQEQLFPCFRLSLGSLSAHQHRLIKKLRKSASSVSSVSKKICLSVSQDRYSKTHNLVWEGRIKNGYYAKGDKSGKPGKHTGKSFHPCLDS